MKTLLITGGSAGIGAETARRFRDDGYAVVNLSRRPCPVDGVTQIDCDLADPGFADALAPELEPHLDRADRLVVVHNAARMDRDTAGATAPEQMRAVMQVNVVAPTALNRLCVPAMKPGSAIVYVGSTLSEKAVPGSYSYVTSKHAMIGMMRATCQDLAGSGIHTVCVCPGFTDTEMLRNHVPAEALDSVRAMSAFNRLIDPAEIAEAIHWSAANPVINGAVIHANLGQVER
ncbi:MAG: short-chain dehydrogenase [Gammaproteobacteria bacterium]|nr:short-chain dehydrogenase [Gammaproteobacteria bacterium]|tara:strand:- start:2047 stop:2742 length:696 start_codon:yes stop_codon:yes gene_type:complete